MKLLLKFPGEAIRTLTAALILLTMAATVFTGPSPARADIWVANQGSGTIGRYKNDGTVIDASFITGIIEPTGVAVSGTSLYVSSISTNNIARYDAITGAVINANFITGLQHPEFFAISNSKFYVTNYDADTVGVYDSNGNVINAALITGLSNPYGIAVSDTQIFVSNYSSGRVGSFTLSGAGVHTPLLTNQSGPEGLALSGNNLYVVSHDSAGNKIGLYNASTGSAIDALLVTGLSKPSGIALLGSYILVSNNGLGTIGEYTTAGDPVNTSFISGLSGVRGIAVGEVPEPSTLGLAAMASLLLLRRGRVTRRRGDAVTRRRGG
jgi:hypothetical protein